jgi:hypothetical protein
MCTCPTRMASPLRRSWRGKDHRPVVVLTSSRDRRDFEALLRRSPARGFVEKERLSAATLAELLR